MPLASPERMWWLWIAIPIIGFYILKTRLRRRSVATLLFWDQLFEEKRQRSLWQNLRHWLSLLLQLVFVALVVLALADPLWRSQDDSGHEWILVVDNSASMQAIDPETGQTRLQLAIQRAIGVARGLRPGEQMALVTAGSSVRVLVGMSDFAPAIEDALASIDSTDGPTRVREAIEAARRLADDEQRRQIVVFSDLGISDRSNIDQTPDVRWEVIGASQSNVAITRFQVRRSTVDPIGYALLVEVQNLSDEPIQTRLTLTLNDDLVDVLPIKLDADGQWRRTIDGASRVGGVLKAVLDVDDGLDVDNMAHAIVPARPLVPVTLVTQADSPSFYLRTVLESIPLIELTVIDAAQGIDSAGGDAGGDLVPDDTSGLVVYSGTVPGQMPPCPALFIATADGPASAWKLGDSIATPLVAKQDKNSPLLRHVQLQNVLLAGGRDIDVDESFGQPTTLLETADGSRVLVSVERPEGRVIVLTANLDDSDLPLRIAFPVMMTNAMNWFFRQSGDMNPALGTGQLTTVPWDRDDESVVLMSPDGTTRKVTVSRQNASISPVDRTGIYGLFVPESIPDPGPGETKSPGVLASPQDLKSSGVVQGDLLAVNVCDAGESDLRVADVAVPQQAMVSHGGAPAWFYLLMLAIGLVIGEWALFNRRTVA
ncbi:hypothetical protein K227x_09750 [Rubripirellula lacrimiformis]|uniref:VWFA domain-containing protein n=1 Tax=Rubripirellula lacrimiformis TaxID=1930273 RepID=A0A517N628_9BACT|nr:BatA and WFA domain-containing protein [Rubripirellula lacrimiformis]QDT02597.1 hypothetical protein K227x_09750 [Rubripirellula lacrimiformis]